MTEKQQQLLENLRQYIKEKKSALIAFSGGVDSTFLLFVAREVLGDGAVAASVSSEFFPNRETKEAVSFCKEREIPQLLLPMEELSIDGVAQNPPNRCYLCKKALFQELKERALANGLSCVMEGSNLDDEGDYRPGLQAIAELGIESPLRACQLTKADVRAISKALGLPTFQKPSFACLASRFVYGEEITREKLAMVEAAEELLFSLGICQGRVRIHDTLARIEVEPAEFDRVFSNRETISRELKKLGFSYVSLDLEGYRTGSMNEIL